jgi:hypothetical protein
VAQANRSLAGAALTSPIAGRVSAVAIAVGDTVGGSSGSASSGQSGSAATGNGSTAGGTTTAQIVVISTDAFVVNANVGSADVTSLKKGLQAQITPTGTNTPVFGTVSSVGFVASSSSTSTSSSTTTFPVVIAVTGKPAGLLVGGTASVSIIVKQLDNVLAIPASALSTVNGQTVVHQLTNGKQVDTAVTIGATYGGQTEIVAGLAEGDQYVLPAGTTARTGQTRRTGTTGGGGGFGGGQGGFGGGTGGTGGRGGGGQGGPAPAGAPAVVAP